MAKKTDYNKEEGVTGVSFADGSIQTTEYNRQLTGLRALDIYEQMRRGDATVKASLNAVKLAIKNADFYVDPASADQADRDVADFVYDCLMHVVDWKQFINEALTYLDFGFSVFEMVFEPRAINGQTRLALVKLGFRKQTSITKWQTETKEPGIQQSVDGKTYSIPLAKLVRFTNEQEGDNFEGVSLLRAAYKHWKIKDRLYKIDAVGHENQSLGILDITIPKGANEKDKKAMKTFAMQRRANEVSHIMKPEGWTVEIMDMKAKSLKEIEPSINHHDRQIMKNVLAAFLEMGSSGSSGSRATSEDHSRLFELSIQTVAAYLVDVIQHTVVQTLVDLNFTNRPYPTLRVEKISDNDIPVISEAVGKLVTAGALHPQAGDENTIRKMLGLPELTQKELDAVYAVTEAVDESDEDKGIAASVTELSALRASVEAALYGESSAAA